MNFVVILSSFFVLNAAGRQAVSWSLNVTLFCSDSRVARLGQISRTIWQHGLAAALVFWGRFPASLWCVGVLVPLKIHGLLFRVPDVFSTRWAKSAFELLCKGDFDFTKFTSSPLSHDFLTQWVLLIYIYIYYINESLDIFFLACYFKHSGSTFPLCLPSEHGASCFSNVPGPWCDANTCRPT